MGVITLESLGPDSDDELRAKLDEADVVIGVDVATDREFTVFGTPPLESTCSLKRPSAMRVVRVPLDGKVWGLEKLIGAVRAVKGYEPDEPPAP